MADNSQHLNLRHSVTLREFNNNRRLYLDYLQAHPDDYIIIRRGFKRYYKLEFLIDNRRCATNTDSKGEGR